MRLLITTYLIFQICILLAQSQSKAAVFVSNANEEQGVYVKWLYPNVYVPEGFDVYRSEGNGGWKKLNSSPLKVNQSANTSSYDKEAKELYSAVIESPYEEFKTNLVRAFVMIKAIFRNDFAEDLGVFYFDKSAVNGNKYKYKVTLANSNDPLAESNEISAGLYDSNYAPEEIYVERNKEFIAMNWKPDVYRYYGVDVYRKEIGGNDFEKMTKIGPITIDINKQRSFKKSDIFFVDTLVDNEKGYIYKLKAVNYLGQESDFSAEQTVPIKDFVPPAAPFEFKARAYSVEGFARLTWNAIDEVDLAGFNIYASQDPEAEFQKINTTLVPKSGRKYDTENLEVGGYYFVVSSVDLAGNETPAGMMFAEVRDVTPPSAPQNLESKSDAGKITLTWDANKEGDLLGYYVQKSLSDSNNLDNDYVILNNEICKENRFEIDLPKNIRNKFVYRVVALDTLFNISKPSINSLAQMPDVVGPKKPVLINVKELEENVEVEWIANVDSDLAGYNLLRRHKGDSTFTQINFSMIPVDVTAYKDRSAVSGEQYEYTLIAVDKSGNKSENSEPYTYSKAKEKLVASIEIKDAKFSARKKEVSIEWEINGIEEVKGYVVYQMTSEGILKPVSGLNETTEYRTKKISYSSIQKFEIRAYTMTGEIIKSELFEINTKDI